jgi:IPT/TIG domain-containing protein
MQLTDPNNPNEKKKLIAAGVLGLAAILVLGYVFFGGSSKTTPPKRNAAAPTPTPVRGKDPGLGESADDTSILQPINYPDVAPPMSEPNRNIFAYYEPPPPPVKVIVPPSPTPTPVPPLTLSSLTPSTVYARTADFNLQVTGDKFTPAVHVVIDGRDLPTRFINNQQLFATVPAAIIANPGQRQLMVRNNDGKLYSNTSVLSVSQPPLPNYNYIGIIGKPRANDIAVLQDKGNKDLLNVQRGDVLGGRFRVNSISEREVVLVDTTLKIRHTIPFTVESSSGQPYRPPVRPSDDEP